jgi:hypothetical protein
MFGNYNQCSSRMLHFDSMFHALNCHQMWVVISQMSAQMFRQLQSSLGKRHLTHAIHFINHLSAYILDGCLPRWGTENSNIYTCCRSSVLFCALL